MNKIFVPDVPIRPNTAVVVGESDLINGVFGSSKQQTGVVGHSSHSVGVSGVGKLIGVSGEAGDSQGVGVHGKGGRLAGLFEGDVDVTGSLNVKGVDMSALLVRIALLEHQGRQQEERMNDIETRLKGQAEVIQALLKKK